MIRPQYGVYQRGLLSMVYKFFGKKFDDGGIKSEVVLTQEIPYLD